MQVISSSTVVQLWNVFRNDGGKKCSHFINSASSSCAARGPRAAQEQDAGRESRKILLCPGRLFSWRALVLFVSIISCDNIVLVDSQQDGSEHQLAGAYASVSLAEVQILEQAEETLDPEANCEDDSRWFLSRPLFYFTAPEAHFTRAALSSGVLFGLSVHDLKSWLTRAVMDASHRRITATPHGESAASGRRMGGIKGTSSSIARGSSSVLAPGSPKSVSSSSPTDHLEQDSPSSSPASHHLRPAHCFRVFLLLLELILTAVPPDQIKLFVHLTLLQQTRIQRFLSKFIYAFPIGEVVKFLLGKLERTVLRPVFENDELVFWEQYGVRPLILQPVIAVLSFVAKMERNRSVRECVDLRGGTEGTAVVSEVASSPSSKVVGRDPAVVQQEASRRGGREDSGGEDDEDVFDSDLAADILVAASGAKEGLQLHQREAVSAGSAVSFDLCWQPEQVVRSILPKDFGSLDRCCREMEAEDVRDGGVFLGSRGPANESRDDEDVVQEVSWWRLWHQEARTYGGRSGGTRDLREDIHPRADDSGVVNSPPAKEVHPRPADNGQEVVHPRTSTHDILIRLISLLRVRNHSEFSALFRNQFFVNHAERTPLPPRNTTRLLLPHLVLRSPLFPWLEAHAGQQRFDEVALTFDVSAGRELEYVPYFFAFPGRDLVSDALRRNRVLDCPESVVATLKEYRNLTDFFLDVGGFLGDCAMGAAAMGWARRGVALLDVSEEAVAVFWQRTVPANFKENTKKTGAARRAVGVEVRRDEQKLNPSPPSKRTGEEEEDVFLHYFAERIAVADYRFVHVPPSLLFSYSEEGGVFKANLPREVFPRAEHTFAEKTRIAEHFRVPLDEDRSYASFGVDDDVSTRTTTTTPATDSDGTRTNGEKQVRRSSIPVVLGGSPPRRPPLPLALARSLWRQKGYLLLAAGGVFFADKEGHFEREVKNLVHRGPNEFQRATFKGPCRRADAPNCIPFATLDGYFDRVVLPAWRESVVSTSRGGVDRSGPNMIGIRMKVSGAENLVLRGSLALFRSGRVAWLHVYVLSMCECEAEIREMLDPYFVERAVFPFEDTKDKAILFVNRGVLGIRGPSGVGITVENGGPGVVEQGQGVL